ncbi:hypothetical protein Trydic_g13811 [Trypoxylus dichotomus]
MLWVQEKQKNSESSKKPPSSNTKETNSLETNWVILGAMVCHIYLVIRFINIGHFSCRRDMVLRLIQKFCCDIIFLKVLRLGHVLSMGNCMEPIHMD